MCNHPCQMHDLCGECKLILDEVEEPITFKTEKMNVYEFQIGTEKEWIAARTMVEAFQVYHGLVNINELDPEDDDVIIIPESKWPHMKITFPDDDEEEDMTFAEYMKTCKQANYIASTVY